MTAGGPTPLRLQLSRLRGYSLQGASRALNGLPAKRVTRPGKWGNPFTIADTAARYGLDPEAAQEKAVALCGQWLRGTIDPALSPGPPPSRAAIRTELNGHNLACWCRPGTPCHADVLIELANGCAMLRKRRLQLGKKVLQDCDKLSHLDVGDSFGETPMNEAIAKQRYSA